MAYFEKEDFFLCFFYFSLSLHCYISINNKGILVVVGEKARAFVKTSKTKKICQSMLSNAFPCQKHPLAPGKIFSKLWAQRECVETHILGHAVRWRSG
jgi:hypothetical protein